MVRLFASPRFNVHKFPRPPRHARAVPSEEGERSSAIQNTETGEDWKFERVGRQRLPTLSHRRGVKGVGQYLPLSVKSRLRKARG